jgi:RalA-binding protein 1
MDTASALHICKYISTHTIEPNAKDVPPTPEELESPNKTGPGGRPLKSGYLTKRGKNFGGWKARFFVLDGPVFKYYEGPGGAHLGAIKLQHAKIAKQQQTQQENQQDDLDNQYRHAFLILEPKRRDSSSLVKHLLCAESDRERDEWVDALIQYVEFQESEDDRSLPGSQHGRTDSDTSSQKTGASSKRKIYGPGRTVNIQPVNESQDDLQALPYEATMPGQTPKSVGSSAKSSDTPSPSLHTERDGARFKDTATPSPTIQSHESEFPNKASHPQTGINISGPKNATRIEDNSTWGNKMALLPPDDDKKNQKKRSFFGFGSRPRPSSDSLDKSEISSLSQLSYEQHGPIRAVFGAPLGEAVMYNHPVDVDIELPAVVYRCVEYLDHHNAASEEGIFRLSGSNVIIKALRERFNVEGDVNLVTDDQYYDIHAVASLLKLYLRELPTTILTRELHLDFLAVTELGTLDDKIAQLCRLVHKLPRANNTLLRYLASFLINIVNHSSVNKMTVRNVGIVFSPTLNIPAPVFAMFLEHYERIFDAEPTESQEPSIDITVTGPSQNSDDIRSPRKMQFQDLPTPTYGQDSFSGGDSLSLHKAAYDTGFSPLPSTHENVPIPIRTLSGPEYGRLGKTIAGPAYGSSRSGGDSKLAAPTSGSSRQKRRESSMFGMGVMGKRDRTTNEGMCEEHDDRNLQYADVS